MSLEGCEALLWLGGHFAGGAQGAAEGGRGHAVGSGMYVQRRRGVVVRGERSVRLM